MEGHKGEKNVRCVGEVVFLSVQNMLSRPLLFCDLFTVITSYGLDASNLAPFTFSQDIVLD